ncbi:MAG: 4Fe-4S ferredoxin [Cyanobacteria bacterium QS_8_64_29]|nr:MAG: 4Fe-4S ferredoxin [Cyanobacteria bacterium QS_8_64_29]
MTERPQPLQALQQGHWFKLICGASYQHQPAVRSLSLAYALAGADCIDVAADPAAIAAAREGVQAAQRLAPTGQPRPWLMVSLNDGDDPHFRKAEFDVTACPPACPQPCIAACPAEAITFQAQAHGSAGVIAQRCYGCGRCLPVCPSQLIQTRSYQVTPQALSPQLASGEIDAIEIHTQVGREREFRALLSALEPYRHCLKLLAISCPDGPQLLDYLRSLARMVLPAPHALIWQTDGRPMSGDIGVGTARASLKLARKVLAGSLPGYVQLAGGTNQHTVTKLAEAGLLSGSQGNSLPPAAGIAYGSYARSLLSPVLAELEALNQRNLDANRPYVQLEQCPQLCERAVAQAQALVSQLKAAVLPPERLPAELAAASAG